jgi:hypothetical protein
MTSFDQDLGLLPQALDEVAPLALKDKNCVIRSFSVV